MKMEKVVNLMKEQKVRRGKASANRGWGGMNKLSLLWVIVFRIPRSVLCTPYHSSFRLLIKKPFSMPN